jgi:hypothetical protein
MDGAQYPHPVAPGTELAQIESMHDWMKSSSLNSRVEFLLADLDAALTFLDVAKTTTNEETRKRNFQNARHAYDTVVELMQKVTLNDEQNEEIQEKLTLLRTRLAAAGQKF